MREWLIKARQKETYEDCRKAVLYGISEEVTAFFENDAPGKFGFEKREGQLDMAYDILDALIQKRHIAVEAGVGIGKSFAYLLPLILYSAFMEKPVVAATSTIALQEQLQADVRRLQRFLGVRQDVILAKGQTHYVCLERAEKYLTNPHADMGLELRDSLMRGCEDRASFPFPIPQDVWRQINIQRYGKHDCENCKSPCQYSHIRQRLKSTRGIILCNQDLLTAHLLKRKRRQDGLLSPLVDVMVVDEAHNLEAKVRSALTERLSYNALSRTMDALPKELREEDCPEIRQFISNTRQAAFDFFQCLYQQIREQMSGAESDPDLERFFFRADAASLDLLHNLAKNMNQLSERVEALPASARAACSPWAAESLDETARTLNGLLGNLERKLIWIERAKEGAELLCCPRNIPLATRELYFRGHTRTILTSATLTNLAEGSLEDQYGYFIRSTGFPSGTDGFLAEPKPSPFPYNKHAMLYYCDDLPHPTTNHDEFIRKGVRRLVEILNISHGKALVLFTSRRDLEEVYALLREKKPPYTILKQQSGPSQDKVRQRFEDDTDSVLLGAGAWWEGISIEGKSLSNLVIFRLPFPVPDPIIDSKASVVPDPLMEVQVPEMMIRLKQGVGRLIRSFTDTGIVSIIDPRLRDDPPTRYRDAVWAALPVQNRTNSIRELRRFYKSLQNQ